MSTKTTKKTATKKSTKTTAAAKELVASQPSLQEILAGTSPAVAKAVAEKRAKVEAEKPLAPAPAKKVAAAKKAAKKGDKKADEKTAKEPRATSGALIKQMILAGDDAETILAAVKKAFPDSNATKGDVSWNKWDLKRNGLLK